MEFERIRAEKDSGGGYYLAHTTPLSPEIPLAIGDCLRCLRSALDYLVAALARKAGLSDEHIVFPFNEEAEIIKRSFAPQTPQVGQKKAKRAGAMHELSGKYPDLGHVILERVRPYSKDYGSDASGDLLWRLITMDNVDKHRLITPTTQATTIANARVGGLVLQDVVMIGPAIGLGARVDHVENYGNTTQNIVFPSTTRLANAPVIETLVKGCNLVAETIELFEEFFVRKDTAAAKG